jgi:hypothetical protein
MTDNPSVRLTELTGNLIEALREQVEELVCAGHVDGEALRLVITRNVRRELVKADHEAGMSQRAIAEKLGVSQTTVCKDLAAEHKCSPSPLETEHKCSPSPLETAPPGAPIQTDIEDFTGPPEKARKPRRSSESMAMAGAVIMFKNIAIDFTEAMLNLDPYHVLAELTEDFEPQGKRIVKIAPRLARWLSKLEGGARQSPQP